MTPSTLLRPHAHGNRIFSLYRYQIHLKPSSGSFTRDHDAPRPLTREHAQSTADIDTEHERAARAHECEPACHATPPGAKLRFASRTTRYSHQTCTQAQVGARTEGCEAGMRGSSGASPAAWVGRVGVSELRVGETPSASRRSSGRWRWCRRSLLRRQPSKSTTSASLPTSAQGVDSRVSKGVRGMRPCARALAPDPGAEAIRVGEAGLAYRFGRCRTKRSSRTGLPGCSHLGPSGRARGSHAFHSCTNHGQRYSSEYVSVRVGRNEWVRA